MTGPALRLFIGMKFRRSPRSGPATFAANRTENTRVVRSRYRLSGRFASRC